MAPKMKTNRGRSFSSLRPMSSSSPRFSVVLILAHFLLSLENAFVIVDAFTLEDRRKIRTSDPCFHQREEEYVTQDVTYLTDGATNFREIEFNHTHLYEFAIDTTNTTLLNQKDSDRKVIFNLEPCKGTVYLFVRKTRPCFPDPCSCLDGTCFPELQGPEDIGKVPKPSDCLWTHFVSKLDGTRDGASTFFELPLTSTRYYLSVYGKTRGKYTLIAMTDVAAYPRPGGRGMVEAHQTNLPLEVTLSWRPSFFRPATIDGREIGTISKYLVYSAMLLDRDERTNAAVFLTNQKIMNTDCGLTNNTDTEFNSTDPSQCQNGYCNATIHGVILNRRYVFNVVAETDRGYRAAYSGVIVKTDWEVKRREGEGSEVYTVLPTLFGSVLGLAVTLYIWMVNWY